jgi:hypothetical protein
MEPTALMVLDGSVMAVERWSMVVVYERATGRIVHRHQSVTFKGAQPPDMETLERAAVEFASPNGKQAGKRWAALHVDPKSLKEEAAYKVDPRKKVLVEVKRRTTKTKRR